VPGLARRGPCTTSISASSSKPMVRRSRPADRAGTHTSGSNSPTVMTSSGSGSTAGSDVTQPRAASAWRRRINEKPGSSGASSHVRSTPAAAATDHSRAAVSAASPSGRCGGRTKRSWTRSRPAAWRVRRTPWSIRARILRDSSSSTLPASVSCTPSRLRSSSGAPTISSSRRICWLSVGWATNIRSAASVNVPASATATRYRRWRSSTPRCVPPASPNGGSAPGPCFISCYPHSVVENTRQVLTAVSHVSAVPSRGSLAGHPA
jgi:hypothetical protein